MIEIKGLGTFETVPQVIEDIANENLSGLEKRLQQGWNINEYIKIDEYTNESPLYYALISESFESVKWLVEHGANLNDKQNPSFLLATRFGDEKMMLYLAKKGANIHAVNRVGSDAFTEARYGEKYHHLPIIERLGHTANENSGKAFRSAIFNRDRQAIEFFVNHGVDMNYNKPDQVFPLCDTPLCVAAQRLDLDMCKYLVEHGADVTLGDTFGNRPYTIALEENRIEIAEYFKSLEPADFHSLEKKLLQLKSYKLPESLLNFLQGDNLRLDFGTRNSSGDCAYIVFFALTDNRYDSNENRAAKCIASFPRSG